MSGYSPVRAEFEVGGKKIDHSHAPATEPPKFPGLFIELRFFGCLRLGLRLFVLSKKKP